MLSFTKSRLAGKTLLQTLFFLLLVTQICFAQWELKNPLITQNTLNDVTLIDENNGWAVGDAGTIIKTTNGGIDWLPQESGTINSLRGISFVDPNTGWTVGENGTILKTSDGGSNWIMQNSGVTDNLNDISFANINNGLVVGEQGRVLKTNDGGNVWIAQTMGNTIILYSVCLVDDNNGWVVGDNSTTGHPGGIIKRTTDSGNTWNAQASPINWEEQSLYEVCFIDSNNGWIVGQGYNYNHREGIILATTNGGSNWASLNSETESRLDGICFIDANIGWIVGGNWGLESDAGVILRTTDGGVNWTEQESKTLQDLRAVSFSNSNKSIVVGNNGTILLTNNQGSFWTYRLGGVTTSLHSTYFTNENAGIAVGDCGTILKTTNSGVNWNLQSSGTINTLFDVCFADENNGWVVGGSDWWPTWLPDSSVILHTTDGGNNWTAQVTGTLNTLYSVFFIDTYNGWASGKEGTLLKTNDGGTNWIQCTSDSLSAISKVFFIDQDVGWITVGTSNGGSPWPRGIYKTTDGGTTWSLQINVSCNDIFFTDQYNGFAVGMGRFMEQEWGIVNKTTDGGETWSSDSIYAPAFDISLVNNKFIILGEPHGGPIIIYWSTDNGTTWIPRPTSTFQDMYRMFFTDDLNGWVVGANGTIIHTTNGGITFVEEDKVAEMPVEYLLSQNFPNPFNPSTKIKYSIPQSSNVLIKVFDILGNEVETLVNEEKSVGTYELTWYAENLPSGVYFYQLRAGDFIQVKKMLLLK